MIPAGYRKPNCETAFGRYTAGVGRATTARRGRRRGMLSGRRLGFHPGGISRGRRRRQGRRVSRSL